MNNARFAAVIMFFASALLVMPLSAQIASFQLTNPAVDAVAGDKTAAWVVDENMGVLFCELVSDEAGKRVECYDGNGLVSPSHELPVRP
ncbi:MAG: hypothetical protein ACU84Q_21230 [Gammaproteobacteria bacterium]